MRTTDESTRYSNLERLHEQLTSAVSQIVAGEDWKCALAFATRFRSRSFANTLLIWAQHLDAFEQGRVSAPEPTYVAGYKQWQSLGRQVEKASPAT